MQQEKERKGAMNLDLPNTYLWWQGYGGMKIYDLVPKLRELQRYQDKPDYLVIHCGANNVGQVPLKRLLELLEDKLSQILNIFSQSKIIWSCTLPRNNWHFSSDVRAMEQTITRLDRAAIAYVISQGVFFL